MKVSVVIPNYNSARIVVRAVDAMLRQELDDGDQLQIVVADDGSTDGSADQLEQRFSARIVLVRLPTNLGRSSARNAGARAIESDALIFVDSDCVPPDSRFVSCHLAALRSNAGVSFGAVETPDNDFWSRLQRDATTWRKKRFQLGDVWTFTTQNFAVRREAFEQAGGFDPTFDRYGFEDRDLFIKLGKTGVRVVYTPGAKVVHEDRITLANVARKLGEAGYHSADQFRQKHPVEYAGMSYSRIDCAVRPWLRWVDALLWPLARFVSRKPDDWLASRALPFRLRAAAARLVYGLAFLHGTAARQREKLQHNGS